MGVAGVLRTHVPACRQPSAERRRLKAYVVRSAWCVESPVHRQTVPSGWDVEA